MEERKMSRMLSVVALSLAVLASGACINRQLSEAQSTQPRGTAFDNALSRDYLAMAKSEGAQWDYKDTETFARRSHRGGAGQADAAGRAPAAPAVGCRTVRSVT